MCRPAKARVEAAVFKFMKMIKELQKSLFEMVHVASGVQDVSSKEGSAGS